MARRIFYVLVLVLILSCPTHAQEDRRSVDELVTDINNVLSVYKTSYNYHRIRIINNERFIMEQVSNVKDGTLNEVLVIQGADIEHLNARGLIVEQNTPPRDVYWLVGITCIDAHLDCFTTVAADRKDVRLIYPRIKENPRGNRENLVLDHRGLPVPKSPEELRSDAMKVYNDLKVLLTLCASLRDPYTGRAQTTSGDSRFPIRKPRPPRR